MQHHRKTADNPVATRARSRRSLWLRGGLAAAVAGVIGASGAGGCTAPFDPQSLVNSVRVLSVDIDKPYPAPGDDITLEMTYYDGRETDTFTPVTIIWLAGCYNPEGDQYYGCYGPLGELFAQLQTGQIPPDGLIAAGPGLTNFTTQIPEDILSSLPDPDDGTQKVGLAYFFFLACAGEIRFVQQEGDTAAGSFPLGCFDAEGRQLGPDAFVPGYTQVYVFEDGRQNGNPNVAGLLFDGQTRTADETIEVGTCPISVEDRRKAGCSAPDEFAECTTFDVDVDVPDDVAEVDPDAFDTQGNQLSESVWVSYFSTGGDFQSQVKLVSDSAKGRVTSSTVWVPPDEPGLYRIWAVVRDNRGGSTTVSNLVEVTE